MRWLGTLSAAIGLALLPNTLLAATTYKYDTLGRLACVAYDDGNVIIYSYDAAGNRTQVAVQGGACP